MQAVGTVEGFYENAETGKRVKQFHQKNLILFEGADIMSGLLGGDSRFFPSHMYFLYENTNGSVTPAPTLSRSTSGRSYFSTITGTSPRYDWLRVPIVGKPTKGATSSNYSGNVVFFSASSAASQTLAGESPAHNYFAAAGANGPSKVISLALVAAVNPNNNQEDLVFSRLNLVAPHTMVAGYHITYHWSIAFK